MRLEPEGSLTDIPTVMEREAIGTSSETAYMDFPYTQVKTRLKESKKPTTLCGTKVTNQAEVLASTRQFFANIPADDQRTPSGVYVRDNDNVLGVPTTTIVTTTTSTPTSPTMVDTNLRGTGSPRISLPERTMPGPTATATYRSRPWMQQLTEEKQLNPGGKETVQMKVLKPWKKQYLGMYLMNWDVNGGSYIPLIFLVLGSLMILHPPIKDA